MSTPTGYSIEMLRDSRAIERQANAWSELPQARESPLMTPEWNTAAMRTLHEGAAGIALRRDGALAAFAPLAPTRVAGQERLELAGAHALHEPSGLLFRDPESLGKLCSELVALGKPLVLQRVPASGPLPGAFAAAARGHGRLFELPAAAAPVVNFSGDFAAYEAGLSSRRRQDCRRARRRLEREGPVTFDLRIPTPHSVDVELDEAMGVESSGWKKERGSALASNKRLGAFFRELARALAARGSLRICFLRVNGIAIATQIGIEHASRWWILKIGYDEQWAAFSPGVQLMWDVLRHANETRLAGVEMLGSSEEWLSIWTDQSHEFRTLVFYPYNLRGMAALAADAAGAALRRLSGSRH